MASTYIAQPNQSMYDVIIMATGSEEAGMQFCFDNAVSLTDTPTVGAEYIVSDAALLLGDAIVLNYLKSNNIVLGTLGVDPLPIGLSSDNDDSELVGEDGVSPFVNE